MNRSLDSLKSYLHQEGSPPRWAPAPGVVVLGAGKGGLGCSTVSALVALAGAREGRKVLLVDGDESVGSLRFLLGLTEEGPGLGDLRGGELVPGDLLKRVSESLWFLPGGGGGADATFAVSLGERRALLQRVASLYGDFDLVVVDGGSYLASVLAACGAGAERLITVATRDRVAMAATHALLKVTRTRFPELPLEILVNFQDRPSAEEVFRIMALAGARFFGLRPTFAGSLPNDPSLGSLVQRGISLQSLPFPSSALAAASRIQERLATEQEAAEGGLHKILPFSVPA